MDLTLFVNPEHRADDDLTARFAEHVEQVRAARRAGYDGVAIGNHLSFGSTAWFPPLESLSRLAAEADGMTLATCMLVLPLYHPLHIVEQASLLDAISGGRLILGVAPGWTEDEFKAVGVDHGRRLGRFIEAVRLMQRLWSEETVDFSGKHFRVDGLSLALKSVQKPRPPMWFGGSVGAAVARAARLADTSLGDSWVASSHLVEDVIVEQAAVFREALAEHGKPMPAAFPLLRNIVVAPDRETALKEAGPFLEESYRVLGQWGLFSQVVGGERPDLETLIAGRVVLGSPEECAEELVRLARATGFTRLVARVQWLGMDQRIVLRTVELLANEVRPLVERELG